MANEHSQIVPSMQPTAKVADFKFWCSFAIFGVSAFLIFKKKLHPILIIIIAAILGIAAGYGQMMM